MKETFEKYLRDKAASSMGDIWTGVQRSKIDSDSIHNYVLRIDDKIEFHPKMIEALYDFLLKNARYNKIIFANNVTFKGDIE